MKVHLKQWADVQLGDQQQVRERWEQGEWVPYYARACDMLMVKQKHAASLTDNPAAVTCKRCLKAMAKR
ncbi:hypothetical protein [Aeromonas hydrophila]|uniref:hypothetical protein n=1 Tax=Aeromonas hydrophila TaxID=644 RepID=UPI0023622887|nr:hypothetical protein [Aeromonas hydrophila]